ncbi:hypothetical protein M501DRAFT_1052376 [Patellaria atrata CBS 101060]|uniref:CUE domain-containing protein n=1 Tax=Patellaria atrata CBS 101060 TaxID=1346257 RepID=A0A9P4VSQ0_9PEZI|nr:hypothetical protein M501DRAFT_1052376 [Patellaria atrata CBS 101060]
MSEKQTEKPISKQNSTSGAESPTTARPLDFDDEPQESGTVASPEPLISPNSKPRVSFQDEAPPQKPPRPMNPQAQAEGTLIEAFPDIDAKIVKAVLLASGGQVEPAFNALLSMSDPSFQAEDQAPPPQPPRPNQSRSQLESDELYARQLAQHYQTSSHGYGGRERGEPPLPRPKKQTGLKPNELYDDKEHSFFDDDLPVIQENIKKGFLETQSKVNRWISDFKKKIDGEDSDEAMSPPSSSTQRQNFGPSQSEQLYGIRKSTEMGRRSGDHARYDADPRVLSDDFTTLELRDDEAPPPKPNRPLANPDLFKPTPAVPLSGPVDEVDALYRQPTPTGRQKSPDSGKAKKWQPLTSIAPNPEAEDHDPFSLGDSDDEESKTKDIRSEDTERLKRAASQSASDAPAPALKPAERSGSLGTKDKEAEDLLAGKS